MEGDMTSFLYHSASDIRQRCYVSDGFTIYLYVHVMQTQRKRHIVLPFSKDCQKLLPL